MQQPVRNKNIFPAEVLALFRTLHLAGFFKESMLIGSWVMPLYQEIFDIRYALRTLDIDFAVKFASPSRDKGADIENLITGLGYIPLIMQSGVRKFTRQNFTIEFVVHRKGGRDDEVVPIRKWNITAIPLPFINILLDFPFIADFGDFQIQSPLPEAYFVHKLITAQRRPGESKKGKDLEQCSIIARHIDHDRFKAVVGSLKLSKKTRAAMLISCEAIDFPPQALGLR